MLDEYTTTASPAAPHSKEAEEAVIGSVIINPETYYSVAGFLNHEDFYIHRNRWIWKAFKSLFDNRISVDFITISEELERMGVLDEIGGSFYLTGLINQVPSSINAESYGRLVKDNSVRRKLIKSANEIVSLAYSNKSVEEIVSLAQSSATSATERSHRKRITAKDAASEAVDALINHPRFFTFGVKNLDDRLGGIFAERLYIWGGYQGSGKTAFEIQNMRKNAELGYKVMNVSLEMSPAQMWIRMACGDLGVDVDSVLTNRVDEDTKYAVVNLAGELGDKYQDYISIYPSPMTLMDILSAAKSEHPDILWIDHSNLISGKPKDFDKLEWAAYIPLFLRRDVAKTEKISVHLLQQLNRSSNRENRRPNMHDLRLAGEDDPDMISLIYRKDTDPSLPSELGFGQVEVEIITDKNRFGWTGTESIIFDLPHQRFLPCAMKNLNRGAM